MSGRRLLAAAFYNVTEPKGQTASYSKVSPSASFRGLLLSLHGTNLTLSTPFSFSADHATNLWDMLTAYTAEGMLHIVYHRRRNRHIYSLGLLASPVTIATYFYETTPTRIAWSSSPSSNSKMIVPILQEELFSAPMMYKVSAMISLVQSFLR